MKWYIQMRTYKLNFQKKWHKNELSKSATFKDQSDHWEEKIRVGGERLGNASAANSLKFLVA